MTLQQRIKFSETIKTRIEQTGGYIVSKDSARDHYTSILATANAVSGLLLAVDEDTAAPVLSDLHRWLSQEAHIVFAWMYQAAEPLPDYQEYRQQRLKEVE